MSGSGLMNSWSCAMILVFVVMDDGLDVLVGGDAPASAASVDAREGEVANLVAIPFVANARRVVVGAANGWTLPVSRIVVMVNGADR